MRNRSRACSVTRGLFILSACALALPGCRSNEQQVDRQLTQELSRLQVSLGKLQAAPLPKEMGGMLESAAKELDVARRDSTSSLRLYRLRQPFVEIETLRFLADHSDSAESLDALTALWNGEGSRFANAESPPAGSPLWIALEQSARNRAEKLYRASLPYGKVASPFSGLYYLAEAEGNLRFAAFVKSLPSGAPAREAESPSPDSLRQALDTLDGETQELFESDPTGRSSIPVSAKLKEARELLDQNLLQGATLAILESRLELTRRAASNGSPAAAAEPVVGDSRKSEMLDLWLDMAREGDAETARMIRSSVVPLYDSLSRSGS